ncbi:50S ribosomal protein L24 [Candidatus Bathyarchaeota archaeon]|nr:50S ribosomal protein L24 [Candidatus Bathyarchaeota archaeon]
MKTIKPSKQRKRLYQASVTERYRKFSAPLSSKLKESHGTNSVPVRKGDTVMIMRGDRKGSEGKISQIDRKKYRIFIEGANREKVDGTTILVPIHPSKVMITRLNLDDKWRKKILERKVVSKKAEILKKESPKIEKKKKRKTSKVTKKSGGT